MMPGPEGYPFEKYVARLLAKMGYAARTNIVARGRCISHELDVVAERGGERLMVDASTTTLPA